MTYEKAKKLALEQKWNIGTCSQGEKCWCRTIYLETPIKYKDDIYPFEEEEFRFIARSGEIDKVFAEHIVLQHNQYLEFLNDDRI